MSLRPETARIAADNMYCDWLSAAEKTPTNTGTNANRKQLMIFGILNYNTLPLENTFGKDKNLSAKMFQNKIMLKKPSEQIGAIHQ